MLYRHLCSYSTEGISAYTHFPGQLPNFSRHKALTSRLHMELMCMKQLGALPQGTKHAPSQGLNTWTNPTLQSWEHHRHVEENTDFQPCPCTLTAPLSGVGSYVGRVFWHVVFFMPSQTGSRGGSGWLSPWNRKMWMSCGCTSKLFYGNAATG